MTRWILLFIGLAAPAFAQIGPFAPFGTGPVANAENPCQSPCAGVGYFRSTTGGNVTIPTSTASGGFIAIGLEYANNVSAPVFNDIVNGASVSSLSSGYITAVSGVVVVGSIGQFCQLTGLNNSGTGYSILVSLTGTNALTVSAAGYGMLSVLNGGTGFSAAPTSATLLTYAGTGHATSCAGTITISSALGSNAYQFVGFQRNNSSSLAILVSVNPTVGSSHEFFGACVTGSCLVSLIAVAGTCTSSPCTTVDGPAAFPAGTGGTTSPVAGTAITPSGGATDTVVVFGGWRDALTSSLASTTPTLNTPNLAYFTSTGGTTNSGAMAAYVSTSSTVTPALSWSAGTNTNGADVIAMGVH